MLFKVILGEALPNSLEKLFAQRGFHPGRPLEGGFEHGWTEKFTQLEERVEMNKPSELQISIPLVFCFQLYCVGALLLLCTLTFSLGEESTSCGGNWERYGPIMVIASIVNHFIEGLQCSRGPAEERIVVMWSWHDLNCIRDCHFLLLGSDDLMVVQLK